MVFNDKIANKVSKVNLHNDVDYDHDYLVQIIILALDVNVFYDNNSYILFRRHEDNTSSFNESIIKLLRSEINLLKENRGKKSRLSNVLLELLGTELTNSNQQLLLSVTNYRNNIFDKYLLMKSKELLRNNYKIDYYTKIKILFA